MKNFTFQAQNQFALEPDVSADIKQKITLVHYFELHLGSSKEIWTSEFIFFQVDFA